MDRPAEAARAEVVAPALESWETNASSAATKERDKCAIQVLECLKGGYLRDLVKPGKFGTLATI